MSNPKCINCNDTGRSDGGKSDYLDCASCGMAYELAAVERYMREKYGSKMAGCTGRLMHAIYLAGKASADNVKPI